MTYVVSRFDDLRASLSGIVVTPEDPGYDEARRVWNADIDRRPAVVADAPPPRTSHGGACRRDAPLEMSVRSGAHSTSGTVRRRRRVVIDLSRMNDVEVDAEARRATHRGRCAAQGPRRRHPDHGLAVPSGDVGHTGIAGITLGGGWAG